GAPGGQDGVDRPVRWDGGIPPVEQGLADGLGPDGPQVPVGQFLTDSQDQVLRGGVGPLSGMGDRRPIRPVPAVQPLAASSLDPQGHGGDPDGELPGDRSQRLATADPGYPGPPP